MCEAFYELFAPQLQTNWDNGMQLGLQQNLINKLNVALIHNNRIDDLTKAAEDTAYQQQLLREFHLI